MKLTRKKLRIAAKGLVALTCIVLVRWWWGNVWQTITISPEVTHVTAPLRDDGTIDYAAALNDHFAQGVSTENNAAIPIILLFDRSGRPTYWQAIAVALNTPAIATDSPAGNKFVYYPTYREKLDIGPYDRDKSFAWSDEFEGLTRNPWSEQDHREAAAWLQEMRPILDQVVAASNRDRFYWPRLVLHLTDTILSATISDVGQLRAIANALCVRAQYSRAKGDTKSALADVSAVLKLGFLVGQQPTALERLVGYSMIELGLKIQGQLLSDGNVSKEDAKPLLNELKRLAPAPRMADCADYDDRFTALDQFTLLARYGPAPVEREDGTVDRINSFTFGLIPVHFDPAMREANQWCDRALGVAAIPQFSDREAAFAALASDAEKALLSLGSSKQEALRRFALIYIDDLRSRFRYQDFTQEELNLQLEALNALDYFSSHGRTPADLADFVKTQPLDIFDNAPTRASFVDAALTLSSPGPAPLPPRSIVIGGATVSQSTVQRKMSVTVRLP